MAGEKPSTISAGKNSKTDTDAEKRQRSTISFPYMGLGDGIEVADAIHANVGLGLCSVDQIAAWLGQSPRSSGLRIQLAAARTFGLIDSDGSDSYKITQLGRKIVDPNSERAAKAEAFLNVPLFRAVFDKYRGGMLPPAAALERDMASLGVAEKQKERARQIFERSADQGGFFEHGKDRLVMPAVKTGDAPKEALPTPVENIHGGSGGGGGAAGLHPFIQGLLKELPPPGGEWPEDKRQLWLSTASNIFKIIYVGDPNAKEK